jgi:hypothetical protein
MSVECDTQTVLAGQVSNPKGTIIRPDRGLGQRGSSERHDEAMAKTLIVKITCDHCKAEGAGDDGVRRRVRLVLL